MLRPKAWKVAGVVLNAFLFDLFRFERYTFLAEDRRLFSTHLLLLFLFREYNNFGFKERIDRMC